MRRFATCTVLLLLAFSRAHAAITVPSADGSDGLLNVTSTRSINLAFAASAAWNTPGNGAGVYDSTQWAVVFKYSSVNIAAGTTLTFLNNSARAPVVWLVNGNVTISGTIQLSGANADGTTIPEPGPGGFRGGAPYLSGTSQGSGGFGPGGGNFSPALSQFGGGSFGTVGKGSAGPTYGTANLIPLIGGSGGTPAYDGFAACHGWTSGAAGGGAILIAATGTITINGSIPANGGEGTAVCGNPGLGGGSGGAIRLVADAITGRGLLRAKGGNQSGALSGGDGRIRLETNHLTITGIADPAPSGALVGATAQLWPSPAIDPAIRMVSVAGLAVPPETKAATNYPGTDLALGASDSVSVVVETRNLPLSSRVEVHSVAKAGASTVASARYSTGSASLATWLAKIKLPPDITVLQARVRVQ